MYPSNFKISRPAPVFLALLFCLITKSAFAVEEEGAFGLTSFAFASYLGTGFYTTEGHSVFVLQLPFEHIIIEKTSTQAGWKLNLPLTIGFINFDSLKDIEELPDLNDVGTITFLPGLEYQLPLTINWTVSPFADYGFARDLDSDSNVLIVGAGIKSRFYFQLGSQQFTLGNRFLYAREKSKDSGSDADYSLIETGISYNIPGGFEFTEKPLFANIYYINYYYPNNLVFLEQTKNPIRVGVVHEVGFTISNIPDFLFFEKTQLGLGVRFGSGVNVYRLVYGMPF